MRLLLLGATGPVGRYGLEAGPCQKRYFRSRRGYPKTLAIAKQINQSVNSLISTWSIESETGKPVPRSDRSRLSALAVVAPLAMQIGVIPNDAAAGLNYGIDKVRFLPPVPAGARVRLRVVLAGVEPRDHGQVIMKTRKTREVEGSEKAALIAGRSSFQRREQARHEYGKSRSDIVHRRYIRASIQEHVGTQSLYRNPRSELVDSAGVLLNAIVNEPRVATEQWFSYLGELGTIFARCADVNFAVNTVYSEPSVKEKVDE